MFSNEQWWFFVGTLLAIGALIGGAIGALLVWIF